MDQTLASHIKTALLVTLAAVLVWVFAEGESLRTDELTVNIELGTKQSAVLVRLEDGELFAGRARLRVQGATASLDQLKELLREPIELTTHELGDQSGLVHLADALRRHEAFKGSGVRIVEVEPPSIQIVVETLVTRTVRVRAEVGDALLDGEPIVEPGEVTLRLPERLADLQEWVVDAVVPAESLGRLVPGREEVLASVPVVVPEVLRREPGVVLEPGTVVVTLKLRAQTDTGILESVPIDVRVPLAVSGKYVVTVVPGGEFLAQVRVRGPREAVERAVSGASRVAAEIYLSPDELARAASDGAEIARAPDGLTGLPAGVVWEVDDQIVRVRVALVPAAVEPG